ncbi:hypothetical protein C4D60_Mb01t08750 [Musa balbisiana]|uniref:Nucleoplasmin-like domain-containing protein n=1 Tax=Musa balbisiana TaxID=52838 RepID=A0A4S8JL35_MUSBA|nr:hypothetical protein C4D60_Mb01t08750 [Musa balbisiana]
MEVDLVEEAEWRGCCSSVDDKIGLEVQPGKTVKVDPGENKLLHLSQASLGEVKDKGNEGVPVFVKFDNKKLVIGTLSADKCAQIQYDLVFEKEFELSHGSKNTSIYFLGYKTDMLDEDDDSDEEDADESSDEEEEATPKKVETGNKRPAGSALKTPAPEKKAKVISPAGNQKTGADGKKGSYVATPYPAKQGKTPANSDKSKQQTPKSAGSISCNSCSRLLRPPVTGEDIPLTSSRLEIYAGNSF